MKMSPTEARNHARRHNRIEVKVSDEELDLIRKRAEKVNLNVSAYMRRMATVGEIKLFDLGELYGLRTAIDIFGSNVNQIAKVANSTGKLDKRDIDEVIRNQQLVMEQMNVYYEKLIPKAV